MPKAADAFLASSGNSPGRGRARSAKNPLLSFTLWVALPAVLVYVGVCALVLVALWLMSAEMNAIDANRGRNAIAAALESFVVQLGESAADEATWTEAYVNTYVTPNPAWLDATWGATARISSNYDTALVTDAAGSIVFGETSSGPITGALAEHFGAGSDLLTELDTHISTMGDDTMVAHLALGDSGVVALAGAVIHGNTGQASVPRSDRRILWLAKRIDARVLEQVATRFQLPLPRLTETAGPGDETLSLTDVTGASIATLAWQPARPGDPAFAHAAGIAAVVMLVIGILTATVLVAFRSSIQGRAASDERDWYNARYDAVTGLVNNFGLEESLRALIPRRGGEVEVSIAQIGIDGFTEITGSYGREAGEQLLDALADAIELATDGQVILARTGPAEFTLARAGDESGPLIRRFARKVLEIVNDTVAVGDLQLKLGASIGLAQAIVVRSTIGSPVHMAEAAMARARETGGNHVVEYDPAIEDERTRRQALQADMRRGLAAGEFDLQYQPIVDFAAGTIVGVEALLRWTRRAGGPMSPSEFIPAAEASGLIEDLGLFALRRAVAEIGPFVGLKLSVNVSAVQFRNPLLAQNIAQTLAEHAFPADRLQLEITESFLLAQPERAKRVIEELRARGILIALDDFGTGFSSVGYLRQFKFDRVKLDRSLVENIDNDAVQTALVESTMVYAYAMGLAVTAEGVERREEAAILTRLGCREFQGYLFARPMTLPQLARLLDGDTQRKAG